MADQLQLRGGTTAETATFTGALREVTVDTDKDTLVVHDNALAGGYPLLRQDLSNLPAGTIDNADINASAAIVDTKLDTIATAGKVSNSATTATDANTASAIVARDASGNFTAGTITAALTGAASSNVLKAGDTMTGALVVPLASAATPSLTFTGDLNTGIYSPGADQVAVSTGGTGRLFVDASGKVGVSEPSAQANLHVAANISDATAITWANSQFSVATPIPGNSTANRSTIYFAPYGSDNNYAPSAISCTAGTSGASTLKFFTNASGNVTGDISSYERLRITSGGNVGIGNTDPGALLTVGGSSANGTIHLRSGSSNVVQIYSVSPGGAYSEIDSQTEMLLRTEAGAMRFSTVNTERARIDSSGRLLVGTSSWSSGARAVVAGNSTVPTGNGVLVLSRGSSSAQVAGDPISNIEFTNSSAATFARISVEADGTTGTTTDLPGRLLFWTTADGASSPTERMRINNGGITFIYSDTDPLILGSAVGAGTTNRLINGIYNRTSTTGGGTQSFVVFTNGNVQNTNNSYTALSDIKLKENIVDASSQWDDIKAFQVRNYNLKEGQTHKQIGLIAQEVEPISPGLVYESPDCDAEGNDLGTVTKSVNYSVLYMKAVKALQEAMERIEQLEAKVAALESA
jgi:hypothetical protein